MKRENTSLQNIKEIELETILDSSRETIRSIKESLDYDVNCFFEEIEHINKKFSFKQLNVNNYSLTFKGNQTTCMIYFSKNLLDVEKLIQYFDCLTVYDAIQRVSKKVGVIE